MKDARRKGLVLSLFSIKVKISVNNFRSSVLTINNKNIIPDKITGVITTIPYFLPQEFYYIEPSDRLLLHAAITCSLFK